ncbi:phytase [Pseudarthrobacter sp. ATCC 49987]|uniref:phytase n=1 Tax=Pseudarthrobacter sp. ATCC 49987 TaxID=2698204 RepID=UPI00136DAF84|nr:phytase [Pseudarthrobacter sp. ATCC 49987]
MAGRARSLPALLVLAALGAPILLGCGPGTAAPTPPPGRSAAASGTENPTPGPAAPSPTPALADPKAVPALETEAFSGSGDISDDSAIWIDPATPANSVVIADNKSKSGGGIGVFDMGGRLLQFRPDGMIGNVDLRAGFPSSGSSMVLVGGNNRSDNTLALWALDTATRTLSPVEARSIGTEAPNYGFCMYHSRASGKFYAFVTPNGPGSVQQFELADNGAGKVDAALVRSLPVSSITESCVADDQLGHLYVGQEDVGIWKYGAEPDAGSDRSSVDAVGSGRLEADIEGMSIAYGADEAGYLFVSSQGNSTIAVYDRSGSNPFLKSFEVSANGSVDAVTGTDGLDVTTGNAGPQFEQGLLVVHDESNADGATSNLKYVPLSAVLR